MTGQELLNAAYTAYRGKGISKVPQWGTEKANVAIAIANRKQQEWARDAFQRWNSLFDIRSIGTLNTSIFEYDLDDDFLANSDYVFVDRLDGSRSDYKVVQPSQRGLYNQGFYVFGRNPKKLGWTGQTIDSGLNGGDIKLAGYFIPSDIVNSTDVVSVDDPNWLVYATAAELARNDPARDDQVGNLVGMANDLYQKMIQANMFNGYEQGTKIEYNMPYLGGSAGDDWAGDNS